MCWRTKQKGYYLKKQHERLAYAERYREGHREELRAKAEKYRTDNPEKVKESYRKYRRKRKELDIAV